VASFDGDLAREIKRRNYGGDAEQWQQLNWQFCDSIADQLIGRRIVVF
jgi:DNA-binding GntR family transcriptional regulator